MTSEKKDFYGKEVTDAIKKACEELKVPQEQLEIAVIETGSTGIFGLIRKKAHITANVKDEQQDMAEEVAEEVAETVAEVKAPEKSAKEDKKDSKERVIKEEQPDTAVAPAQDSTNNSVEVESTREAKVEELTEESLEQIKLELLQLLELMGYPSSVEVTAKGTSVTCQVGEKYEEVLTGQDGKTLDSIQYLLRKIVARKILNRIRLTVDVGNYREKRLVELKSRAVELAEKVKADGKTQVIPALSPSERRVVHMSLQDDKEIRSRSVGDGLFKKILIYKPGKGNRGGRKRPQSKGRQNKGVQNPKPESDT
jgi:spoIIIJ-associated protein